MIYIKYTLKTDPTQWSIWAHEKGDKEEIHVLNSRGNTSSYTTPLNIKYMKKYWNIKYLTKEEIDLLKLELL